MGLLTIFMVATLTFFLMHIVPGGPFLAEKAPSEATIRALEQKYGLDKPLHIQYFNYIQCSKGRLWPLYETEGAPGVRYHYQGF